MAVDKLLVVQASAQTEESLYAVVALDVEQVLYGTAFRVLCAFGNFVAFKPVATPLVGEEHHRIVHRRRIDILRKVVVTAVCALAAHSAAGLLAELRKRRALDIAQMADGNHHGVVGVKVLGIELFARILDFRAAFVTVLFLNLLQLVLHYFLAKLRVVKDLLQVRYAAFYLLVLGVQLVHAQAGKLAEAHVYDGLRLYLVKAETLLEVALRVRRGLGAAYDVYHLVNVVARGDERPQYVFALLCLAKFEVGAAYCHVVPVVYEVANAVFQRQQARTAFYQSDAVNRERALQRCHLEQLVQDDVGVGVFLHVDDYAHTVAVALVVGVAYAVELAFLNQVGNVLYELGLVYAVRYLRDYNLVVRVSALNLGLCTHYDASATSSIRVAHALYTIYICPCGEVGSLDVAHQSVHVNVRIVNICAASVDYLAQVVRRYVGSHAHGNTVAAVHEQVGYFRRHDGRLLQRVVKVVHHVDGLLVKVVHDVLAHLREAALRVTHRRGRVAVNATEVALPVNERITHVPILRHAHQRAVHRTVTMRVVLTEHLAYHARAFLIRFVARVADAHHSVKNTAVHGLEAVAHVGQRTGHNHRHRIVDVGGLHLLLDVDFYYPVLVKRTVVVHLSVSCIKIMQNAV